jgi:putative membrane protein
MMNTIVATVQRAPAHSWGHAGWWFPFALVFWLGLAALVAYVVTRVNRRQPSGARSARDILSERFARGEMDSDEYEERLSHLS